MRLTIPPPIALISLFLSTAVAAAASSLSSTLTLAFTPLTPSTSSSTNKPPKPKSFATLAFHSSNISYTLTSYTAPSTPSSTDDSLPLARIGLLPQKDLAARVDGFAGSSTTTTLHSLLCDPQTAVLRLVLDADGAVLSVGLTPALRDGTAQEVLQSAPTGGKGGKKEKKVRMPRLEILRSAPEPRPVLNKPVVLDAQGKVPRKEEGEKTLLQRYWWVIGIVMLVTMVGGGGGGDDGGK